MRTTHFSPASNMRKPRMRVVAFPLLGVLAGLLVACSGGTGTNSDNTSTPSPSNPATGTGTAVLGWEPAATNTDGTAVTLGGFVVYHGASACCLHPIATLPAEATSYTAGALGAGTHYFAVTTVNTVGVESVYSTILSKTIN